MRRFKCFRYDWKPFTDRYNIRRLLLRHCSTYQWSYHDFVSILHPDLIQLMVQGEISLPLLISILFDEIFSCEAITYCSFIVKDFVTCFHDFYHLLEDFFHVQY